MATELWKLRQQVEELLTSKSEFGSEVGDGSQQPSSASAERQTRAKPGNSSPNSMERHIGMCFH